MRVCFFVSVSVCVFDFVVVVFVFVFAFVVGCWINVSTPRTSMIANVAGLPRGFHDLPINLTSQGGNPSNAIQSSEQGGVD